MSEPLLVEFFNALPQDALRGGLDWPITQPLGAITGRQPVQARTGGKAKRRAAIHVFTKAVQDRYSEGTLLRLLCAEEPTSRQAAVFALGLLGSMAVNESLAAMLHDEEPEVARLATEALWNLWFRGDDPELSDALYRVLRTPNPRRALAGLDALIARAPHFAEAYNQRAILHFHLEQYDLSIADCDAALRLNPHHFGAQAGLGQCFLKLHKRRSALRAFRTALGINPHLERIAEAARELESSLDEEGR
jgi:tetratricopeptide (TPR) repeat protein